MSSLLGMPFCTLYPKWTRRECGRRAETGSGENGGGMTPSRAKGQIVTSCFFILFFRLLKKKKKSQLYPETNETTCNAYQNIIFLGVTAVGLRICPKWRAYDIVLSPDVPRYTLMGARASLVASTRTGVLGLFL